MLTLFLIRLLQSGPPPVMDGDLVVTIPFLWFAENMYILFGMLFIGFLALVLRVIRLLNIFS